MWNNDEYDFRRALASLGSFKYMCFMIGNVYMIVFPEGDTQQIGHSLSVNEMVDVNGRPLDLPLSTNRMIAYRVQRISTQSTRNDEVKLYFLELIRADELTEFVE